jgi:hypothetical protein
MKVSKFVIFLYITLALLSISLASAAPAQQKVAGSSRAWRIAFVRNNNIWVANGDGSGQKLIIRNAQAPAWSPDKKQIAFARNNNIWVAKADGTGQRQVTKTWPKEKTTQIPGDWDYEKPIDITWDPVERLLVFSHGEKFQIVRRRDQTKSDTDGSCIYTVSSRSGQHKMETWEEPVENALVYSCLFQDHPAFSRSGKRLAFARNGDIWVETRGELIQADALKWVPQSLSAWKWEATRVAAVAQHHEPNTYADTETYAATHFSWSPDERYIAYEFQRVIGSGMQEVHILDLRTGKHHKLPDDKASVMLRPAFSPDGKWLAYFRGGDNLTSGIWICRPDGSDKRLLIKEAEDVAW